MLNRRDDSPWASGADSKGKDSIVLMATNSNDFFIVPGFEIQEMRCVRQGSDELYRRCLIDKKTCDGSQKLRYGGMSGI